VAKSLQLATSNTTGNPALMVTLETGAELVLEFQPDDLAKMSELISELASLPARSTRH
jgi:hypothetical protein